MPLYRILIIDDEESVRGYLAEMLKDAGYRVRTAEDGEKGIELCEEISPDMVITDLYLPKMDGMGVIQKIREWDKNIPVLILTGHGSIPSAIEAIHKGAWNYLTKPVNHEELLLNVQKALEHKALEEEVSRHRDDARKRMDMGMMNGVLSTPTMKELMQLVEKVALSDAPTVLLQGESGTGKNFLAQMIHLKSKRNRQPFMDINCASLPENLIESELFGHERGSFTDAKQMKKGLFEMARGGTILLDEICQLSLATQAKLLHAIENHKFRRVGGVEDIETDARIIAATNTYLQQAVTEKKFREDLYFRLQLIPISIPPLRDRIDEIPVLLRHFIQKFNKEYHKNIQGITPEAEVFLKTYAWPGNVRELKNVVERIAILENDTMIGITHLPWEVKNGGPAKRETSFQIPDQGVILEEVEKSFIEEALRKTAGNQSRAARLLGITRHTLRYRMEKFGLA